MGLDLKIMIKNQCSENEFVESQLTNVCLNYRILVISHV